MASNISKKTIFLIGLRASGKTCLGALLAKEFACAFYDTDFMVQESNHKSIATLVENYGWNYFRQKEREVLLSIPLEKAVVSTGGGIILDKDNRNYLKENGFCIYLAPPLELLIERLEKEPLKEQRPDLTDKNNSLKAEVTRQYEERKHLYEEVSHLTIDSSLDMDILLNQIRISVYK